jgi:hypothetical protein
MTPIDFGRLDPVWKYGLKILRVGFLEIYREKTPFYGKVFIEVKYCCGLARQSLFLSVLWVRDIRGSVPLANRSGSCYFRP